MKAIVVNKLPWGEYRRWCGQRDDGIKTTLEIAVQRALFMTSNRESMDGSAY